MQLGQATADFLSGYFSTHDRRNKTKAAYRVDLEQFKNFAGAELALSALAGAVIEKWAAHLSTEAYSPASIRRKIVVLRVFCSYWVRRGELPESPFWRVKLSFGRIEQLPRTLTEREMRDLLAQAHRNYRSLARQYAKGKVPKTSKKLSKKTNKASCAYYRALRDLALVDLLFATGMRVGEVSSLDLKDFVVGEAFFRVQGKGGRDRLAFAVDEQTLEIQRKHRKARKRIESQGTALFLNSSGERLSTQGITNVISQLRKEAGIERHITPHMLRHTVATLLLRNGADIRVVQEFLGHASIATTQRYTHITKEHMIGALRRFHPSLTIHRRR
ncbi:MAG TPA: tyrosine-type recombinase/integrase [Candidatus Saccharimonadales bacterium]|jgi:integrase/recombinase XerD|nr:tyrosine-type recombinase/integrase [Candidatus Saccharimonadales bacterium]